MLRLNTNTSRKISKSLVLLLTIYALFNVAPHKPYMLIGLASTLLITVLFRTVFCGWICPLGTIFDLARRLGKGFGKLPGIKPANRKYKRWIKTNRAKLDKLDRGARYFKYVFFLWILQSAFLGIASIKNGGERGIESVLYLLIAFLVLGLFVERSWCRYACPVGAVMGLAAKFSPTRITRNEAACIDCNICSRTCPMNIDVANTRYVQELDCHTCVQCVETCPVDDALELKFKFPQFKSGTIQGRNPIDEEVA